jgi:AraC-like DNA-binding protein
MRRPPRSARRRARDGRARARPQAEPAELLAVLGTTEQALADPETRLDFEAFAHAWACLADMLRDEGVPFAVAEMLRIEAYDVMGFACMTAPTAREALARAARYQRLFTDGGFLELRQSKLVWLRDGSLERGHRLLDESVVACALSHFRQVTGQVRVQRVFFRHAAPSDATQHRSFFGAPIDFDASLCGIDFDPLTLEVVPRFANAALADHFASLGEKALADALRATDVAARTKEVIVRELASGSPTIGLAARRLGMSERTLRRRLEEEGIVFRDLVDDLRAQRARAPLVDGRRSLSDVAFAIGFSEVSSFARAFRRWFGDTPKAYQARAAASA